MICGHFLCVNLWCDWLIFSIFLCKKLHFCNGKCTFKRWCFCWFIVIILLFNDDLFGTMSDEGEHCGLSDKASQTNLMRLVIDRTRVSFPTIKDIFYGESLTGKELLHTVQCISMVFEHNTKFVRQNGWNMSKCHKKLLLRAIKKLNIPQSYALSIFTSGNRMSSGIFVKKTWETLSRLVACMHLAFHCTTTTKLTKWKECNEYFLIKDAWK